MTSQDSSSSSADDHNIPGVLSDCGQYAYCAICAVALHQLFQDDKSFSEQCLNRVLEHIAPPDQIFRAIRALSEGHGCLTADAFLDSLRNEDVLHGNLQPLADELVTTALKSGVYDARWRVFIKRVAWLLCLNWERVEQFEQGIVCMLKETEGMSREETEERLRRDRGRKVRRYLLIGLAAVGGGTLIGLTGGLAAPLVAAGAGAVLGGGSAAILGSAAGIAVIGSMFGVAGAGLGGYKMQKRVGAIEEFEFDTLTEGSDLHITIAVSGWLPQENPDFRVAWQTLRNSHEQYTVKWESKYLSQLGQAIEYIMSFAVSVAAQQALQFTILGGLLAAIAWPSTLVSVASVIDNPWSVALKRAENAGRMLADVLLSRRQVSGAVPSSTVQGHRPVTLIGFSVGARLIFSCLQEMAKRSQCRCPLPRASVVGEGIVEDVILLGAPVTGSIAEWSSLSRVIAGKVVNGFCRTDWFLKFVYRTTSVQMNVAGLRPVRWEDRRMWNIDLTEVISGHLDYGKKMDAILHVVGLRTSYGGGIAPSTPTSRSRLGLLTGPSDSVDSGLAASPSPRADTASPELSSTSDEQQHDDGTHTTQP